MSACRIGKQGKRYPKGNESLFCTEGESKNSKERDCVGKMWLMVIGEKTKEGGKRCCSCEDVVKGFEEGGWDGWWRCV